MKFRSHFRRTVLSLHRVLASASLPVINEPGALLSFLFHSLFQSEGAWSGGVPDPQQGITAEPFSEFIRHLHGKGYGFGPPRPIFEGLAPRGKSVLVTCHRGHI